jgi:hypothetical protein
VAKKESHPVGKPTRRRRSATPTPPTIDEDLQKWTGEGRYARLAGTLEEMERGLVREALTACVGLGRFCAQEMGLEAEKLVEALAIPFAERVRGLEELGARHEVEPDEGA